MLQMGATIDKGRAERIVAAGLVTAWAGAVFGSYPPPPVNGLATERCGLLEVVHNLGMPAT